MRSELQKHKHCRVVLIGGTKDKDTLIQSINVWRVARVIPEHTSAGEIWHILEDVYSAASLSSEVVKTANRLTEENQELEQAIRQLQKAQKDLLHTERLSTVGRIAQGLVTSIRHHLAALDGFSEVAKTSCNQDTRSFMDLAFDATRSVSALLEEMQGYTDEKVHANRATEEGLNDIVQRAVELTRFDPLRKQRNVVIELGHEQAISVERYRLYQVLLNLLRNAFQATEAGDKITVRTYQSRQGPVIEVEDEGSGMSSETLESIFDPFYSTKGEGGMGLGLHLCRVAVERQGGRIECESKLGTGTTFRIHLPLRLRQAASA
jgi:C4-dicarboxylate-specific signal transduction histidine kinase